MRAYVRNLVRAVDETDLSDLTSARRTGPARWVDENVLEVPFDREPSTSEQDAILLRLTTPDRATETTQTTLEQAQEANAAFLARPAPNAAQVTAQVQALTRQVNALIERFQRTRDDDRRDDD